MNYIEIHTHRRSTLLLLQEVETQIGECRKRIADQADKDKEKKSKGTRVLPHSKIPKNSKLPMTCT